MAEIKEQGYQDIRSYIQSTWKYIEIRDINDVPILRVDTTDSRVSWTHLEGAKTLELSVVIRGSDAEVSLPQTFKTSAIYKVGVDGDAYSEESFTPFTMEGTSDELTVKHQIQVPQIV